MHGALSHFHGVGSKAEFVCAAVRGFGSNLMHAKRAELAKLLYNVDGRDARRPPPAARRLLQRQEGKHELYALDELAAALVRRLHVGRGRADGAHGVVQRDEHMLEPWMERMEPLILVGPEGAGKHMLLSKLFARSARHAGGGRALLGADALDARDPQARLAGVPDVADAEGRVYRPADARASCST